MQYVALGMLHSLQMLQMDGLQPLHSESEQSTRVPPVNGHVTCPGPTELPVFHCTVM